MNARHTPTAGALLIALSASLLACATTPTRSRSSPPITEAAGLSPQPSLPPAPIPGSTIGSDGGLLTCANTPTEASTLTLFGLEGSSALQNPADLSSFRLGRLELDLSDVVPDINDGHPRTVSLIDRTRPDESALVVGASGANSFEIGGLLVTATGSKINLLEIPLAGPTAESASGDLLTVGGPTSELLALSIDRGATWRFPIEIPLPEVGPDVDFAWWEYGRPSASASGDFDLPAILNSTPADRSTIQRRVFLLKIDEAGASTSAIELDRKPVIDSTVRAASSDGLAWVASSFGTVDVFDSSGTLQSSQTIAGPVLDMVASGRNSATLLGSVDSNSDTVPATIVECTSTS